MNTEINFSSEPNNEKSKLVRTNFLISLFFLLIELLIPALIIYFLTSPDVSFAYELKFWQSLVISTSLILYSVITTIIFYWLKFHKQDQFTYVIPFAFALVTFYLSGYFLDLNYFLVRFLIGGVGAIVGIILTSIILIIFIRFKQQK